MKPKDYIKKYKLDTSSNFDHRQLVADLTFDFTTLIEYHQQYNWNFSKFNLCVSDIRSKFDAINIKTGNKLDEKLWKYFYATVVVRSRDAMFGDFLKQQREAREKQRREREEYHRQFALGDDDFFSFFQQLFSEMYRNMLEVPIPHESFSFIQLPHTATENDIKRRYKRLALQYHPDKGGTESQFKKLVEAKNRCLAYSMRTDNTNLPRW